MFLTVSFPELRGCTVGNLEDTLAELDQSGTNGLNTSAQHENLMFFPLLDGGMYIPTVLWAYRG